jgi:hypothetical protein
MIHGLLNNGFGREWRNSVTFYAIIDAFAA